MLKYKIDMIDMVVTPGSSIYEKNEALSIRNVNLLPCFKESLPCKKLQNYKSGSNLKRKTY